MSVYRSAFGSSTEAKESLAKLALKHPSALIMSLKAAVASDPMMEFDTIRALLARYDAVLANCFYFVTQGHGSVREIAETLVSAALIGFRRGEPWRLVQVPKASRLRIRFETNLHQVRCNLVSRSLIMSRYRPNGCRDSRMPLSFALLTAPLDTVEGRMAATVVDAAAPAHLQYERPGPADLSLLPLPRDIRGTRSSSARSNPTVPPCACGSYWTSKSSLAQH